MPAKYPKARKAKLQDLTVMSMLPKRPGNTSSGPRSLAFCHPNHSQETLERYYSTYPEGILVGEDNGRIVSFACAIRTSGKVVEAPITWSEGAESQTDLSHQKNGRWLYVSRLTYTAGPGHAHIGCEVGSLLTSLQDLAVKRDLFGVAFAARFPGFRQRSGTSPFQRAAIEDQDDEVRSGLHPIGVAHYIGFRHCLALPDYLGDGRHFALMVWKRNAHQ